MTKKNYENSLPEEILVVDMEMLNISKTLAIPCPTNNTAPYSDANTMPNWFTTQPQVPALCSAPSLHPRPVMEAAPSCVVAEEDLLDCLPMKPFMVDRGVSVSINGMSSNQDWVMAITYLTVTCVSHSVVRTMHGLFAVSVVMDFAFEQDKMLKKAQADKSVNQVELGEPPPCIGV